ncbi:MAG: LamG domain-containing protein [bacterium]|nr:LamG domain-containing protein [bacterium]
MLSRRQFLKVAGTAAVSVPLLARTLQAEEIPKLRAVPLEGVHAYSDKQSVAGGESIGFYVSASVAYEFSIVRLGHNADGPDEDEVIHQEQAPANPQPIYPGSFVHVEKGIDVSLSEFTLSCWVRPYTTETVAGLMGFGGFGLYVEPTGRLSFYLNDGARRIAHTTDQNTIVSQVWQHVVATWDGEEKKIWVNGELVASWPATGTVQPDASALRIGAYGEGAVDSFLDGDLARPTVYNAALSAEQIREGFLDRGKTAPYGPTVLAHWPFDEERGDQVWDTSGNGYHGRIVNHATWMVGGPSFETHPGRFEPYNPFVDPTRGHAVRFSRDDLYDCGWQKTHPFSFPPDAVPGMYAARLRFRWNGLQAVVHVPFVVRPSATMLRAHLAVLVATNTWWAYNDALFHVPVPEGTHTNRELVSFRDTPAFSFYEKHREGQGSYQVGLRVPNPSADPYLTYLSEEYSHLLRAERYFHIWLEEEGIPYDLITDADLHRNPELLTGYDALAIVGHNEYWSDRMYDGVGKYLARGGNVVNLSGNTMFWRVSFNDSQTVMECHKIDTNGNQVRIDRRGESWHSHDGKRGGLMRDVGRPCWKLLGMDTMGWILASNPSTFTVPEIQQATHFLFEGPRKIQVENGQAIGYARDAAFPRLMGHEVDAPLEQLLQVQTLSTPEGAERPVPPEGIVVLAGDRSWPAVHDYFMRVSGVRNTGGAIVYWERPEGGKVFNTGSIATAWTMSVDPDLAALVYNALYHFGIRKEVRRPRSVPAGPADFDEDGAVTLADFFAFAAHYGTRLGEVNFDVRYDLDGDGQISFSDFRAFVRYYMAHQSSARLDDLGASTEELLASVPELRTAAFGHPGLAADLKG